MAEDLRKTIASCLRLTRSLSCRGFCVDNYLSALSNNAESNYSVFAKFAGACPTSLLAVLFRLGHFAADRQLLIIVGEIIELRSAFNDEEEEDEGGHIAYLTNYYRGTRENGKFLFFYFE